MYHKEWGTSGKAVVHFAVVFVVVIIIVVVVVVVVCLSFPLRASAACQIDVFTMLLLDFTVAVGPVAGITILAAWFPTITTDAVSVEVSRDPAVSRGSKGIPFPTRGQTQWYSRYICPFVFDERKAINNHLELSLS
jgi:hypothetical protein